MATYFNKYYFEFQDNHVTSPVTWRMDIMDSEGSVPTDPFLLTMSATPLLTERIDTNDSKDTYIIGRQITISYEYDGNPNIPLPIEFFEATERRFRVEVRRNGSIDGVYFIKPDFCEYADQYPPFTIQLKAVDGFSYAKGILFNPFEDDGSLHYEIIDLYETIMTRSLLLIADPGTIINVVNTLFPENIGPTIRTLFRLFIHTDIFYDFVKGAVSVHDVLTAFCKAFYARCYMAQGQIWFIRTQDLTNNSLTGDQYIDDTVVNDLDITNFVLTGGPDPSSFDVMPVDEIANIRMIPAIKKAEFEVQYKSINQLNNFDWRLWDGTNFDNWQRIEQSGNPLILNRTGSGTIDDPYKASIGYNLPQASQVLQQTIGPNSIFAGDRVEISFKYRFTNCTQFYILVRAGDNTEFYVTLDESGIWDYTFGISAGRFYINRTGKKREGTLTIQSIPIPQKITGNIDFPANADLRFSISIPQNSNTDDNISDPPLIEIYAVKVGIIQPEDKGRHIVITNQADFTQIKETEDFSFIDTGEDGLSNTIFVLDGSNFVPAENWDNDKSGVNSADIERHMAKAHIDQYPRSIGTWEGSLYSNNMEFYNVIEFAHLPGKRWMQLSDKYNNRTCTHQVLLTEVFAEGNSNIDYLEYDIEDTTN